MQNLPHDYKVQATAAPAGDVQLASDGLGAISSAPPLEFDGPGDRWSPETLLVASVADCFVLSFRAIARASSLTWVSVECEVTGTLERSEGKARFTKFLVNATLTVPPDSNEERATRLLHKAEESCLITNSLSATTKLKTKVLEAS